jgi:hypothetical protein
VHASVHETSSHVLPLTMSGAARDAVDLCMSALRGEPGVVAIDGRVQEGGVDEPVVAMSAAELSAVALRHLNELVFNNGK